MDSILKEAGDCGRFQGFHVVFTQLPRFVTVWAVFLMMFGSYDPGWKCVSVRNARDESYYTSSPNYTGGASGITNRSSSNTALSGHNDATLATISSKFRGSGKAVEGNDVIANQTYGVYGFNGSSDNNDDKYGDENNTIEFDGECDVYDVCEEIAFNTESVTVVSRFGLICDRAWMVKCIFLLQGIGYFIGALVGGQVGERFGRKIGLYSSTLIVCLSSGLAIFSPHWSVYALCIFFLGLGANGVISLTSVFSVEFLNSKWRGYFGSLPTWNVSLLIFTVTTAAVKSWIYLHVITFVMSFIACIGFVVVVESPRWLIMNGHSEKAQDAIRKIAKINGKPPPNFDRLLELHADQKDQNRRTYTYLDLFRTKAVRIPALKLSLVMGLFGIIYYAFGWGVQSLPGDFYINAILSSVIEIIVLMLVGPICNRAGRRKAGVFMTVIGAISCLSIVIALFAAEEGSFIQSTVIKAFAFMGKAASQAIFSITSLFIVELLPTVVRNVGIGFCRCVAGLGTLIAPFLIPSSDVISFAVCFAVLGVFYVVQIVIFLSLSETNNLDLLDSLVQNGANKEITVDATDSVTEKEDNKNSMLG